MQILFLSFLIFFLPVFSFTQPVTGETAFTLKEKDLLPENVAYDPVNREFYVGSTRKGKIVKVDRNKKETDFTTARQEGMWQIIGMKVDVKNRWLWVCSSAGENLLHYKLSKDQRPAGIFKYDLRTGSLIKKYFFDVPGELHFFNDLVIAPNGDIFITHTFRSHAIYTIAKSKDELELFTPVDNFKYPNGITISDDGKWLFFAYTAGIGRVNIETKLVERISQPDSLQLSRENSIDGIYFYKNTLIGVQPGAKKVQQFILNNGFSAIQKSVILATDHPKMAYPTTGVLVGDNFYYVANAHFDLVDDDGKIVDENKLTHPAIIMIVL